MKNFRKTDSGHFICEECYKTFKLCTSLSAHVGKYHNKKEYYDKWIKEENEEICPTCGNKNIYLNRWDRGYSKYCCKTCQRMSEETKEKIKASLKETCLEKYGTDNFMSSSIFKEKSKNTFFNKYGVNNPLESDIIRQKIKETNIKKYEVDNASKADCVKNKTKETCIQKYGGPAPASSEKVRNKMKKTCVKKYNVDHPFKSEECVKKRKDTWIKKYGNDNPNKDENVVKKGNETRLKIHKFKDTELFYQGSYELDFLNKYYNKISEIKRGPTIKYKFKNKQRLYFSDFFIPSLNLVIECKSTWTYNKDIDTVKKKATITSGFNYIMILDKNYAEFDNQIQNIL